MVKWLKLLFGNKNIIKETAEVFVENAEAADQRDSAYSQAALEQFAKEFTNRGGWFNTLIDGLNRLPRPLIALGVLALFVSAMTDPIWFASRMQGLALVPDQLWDLLFLIVGMFFGVREVTKWRSENMAKEAARIVATTPQVIENVKSLEAIEAEDRNPALEDWKKANG